MAEQYSARFDPLLLPGQTATLKGTDFPDEGQPVRCDAYGPLPEYIKDFGALTAATWDPDNEDTNLEMPTSHLAQLRMRVLGDFKLRLSNPAALKQWRTANTQFDLYRWPEDELDSIKEFLWRASEFCVWEDTAPRFDLYSVAALGQAYVHFSGWRFKVTTIKAGELTSPQVVWVNGWPGAK